MFIGCPTRDLKFRKTAEMASFFYGSVVSHKFQENKNFSQQEKTHMDLLTVTTVHFQ